LLEVIPLRIKTLLLCCRSWQATLMERPDGARFANFVRGPAIVELEVDRFELVKDEREKRKVLKALELEELVNTR